MRIQKKKIGEILLETGVITQSDLDRGLEIQKESGKPLGKVLVDLGLINKNELLNTLSDQYELPYLRLDSYQPEKDVNKLISENFARHNSIVPLFQIGNTLSIGISDPSNIEIFDEVTRITNLGIEPILCLDKEINEFLDELYGATKPITDVLEKIRAMDKDSAEGTTAEPIIQLVQLIIEQAIKIGASDIHLEPDEKILRVRFRVDGVLETIYEQPSEITDEVLSRFKVMSNLNITEKRLPQDGRFRLSYDGNDYDFRVSSLPTYFGENIVIRILDQSSVIVELADLGMTKEMLNLFSDILHLPDGIILVTGPTGSGKTTTLYSALNAINSINKNIVTIEDPVEYRLPLLRQSSMNAKIGLTFASGLRSILRQDPDIIMVGEIRDGETATVAVQAALTGHLILSTLHTNDTVSTIMRLVDMGVEPFLISATIQAVIAQRLVRKICPKCKQSFTPDTAVLNKLGIGGVSKKKVQFSHGTGCKYCRQQGYKGRVALFEILRVSDSIKNLIVSNGTYNRILEQALKDGLIQIKYDGIRKVLGGITTIDEVLRISE